MGPNYTALVDKTRAGVFDFISLIKIDPELSDIQVGN